jgi:hypothetical protein
MLNFSRKQISQLHIGLIAAAAFSTYQRSNTKANPFLDSHDQPLAAKVSAESSMNLPSYIQQIVWVLYTHNPPLNEKSSKSSSSSGSNWDIVAFIFTNILTFCINGFVPSPALPSIQRRSLTIHPIKNQISFKITSKVNQKEKIKNQINKYTVLWPFGKSWGSPISCSVASILLRMNMK